MGTVDGLRATVPGLTDVVGERLGGVERAGRRADRGGRAARRGRAAARRAAGDRLRRRRGDRANPTARSRCSTACWTCASRRCRSRSPRAGRCRSSSRSCARRGASRSSAPRELSFTASECEELLRLRRGPRRHRRGGRRRGDRERGLADGRRRRGVARTRCSTTSPRRCSTGSTPDARLALVDSAVPATLLAETSTRSTEPAREPPAHRPLGRALLPPALPRVPARAARTSCAPTPSAPQLHARAAAHLTVAGRHAEAIEHWIEAGEFRAALWTLAEHAHELVRTAPRRVSDWLERLPAGVRRRPGAPAARRASSCGAPGATSMRVEPLRAAVAGYRAAGAIEREWLARLLLADTLISAGAFEQVARARAGLGCGRAASAAELRRGRRVVPGDRRSPPPGARDEADGSPSGCTATRAGRALPPPGGHRARRRRSRRRVSRARRSTGCNATIAALEREGDPHGRLPYTMEMVVLVLRDLGERAQALDWLDRCERESERVGLGLRRARLPAATRAAAGAGG